MSTSVRLLFTMLMAALLAAGCSDLDVADGVGGETRISSGAGDRYLGLTLAQVAQGRSALTRAGGLYDHGDAGEYSIHSAVALFFTRTRATMCEAESVFLHAEALGTPWRTDDLTDESAELSCVYYYTARLSADTRASIPADHDVLEILVVANAGLQVAALADGSVSVGGITWGRGGVTFGRIADVRLSDYGSVATGLMMSSSPVADMPGGSNWPRGSHVATLTEVDPSCLFASADDARSESAAEVYVERAAAKVELDLAAALRTRAASARGASTEEGVRFDPAGIRWGIENENSSFYLCRHMSERDLERASTLVAAGTAGKYRMIDRNALQEGRARYRTYWGEDVNYSYADNAGTPASTRLVRHYASLAGRYLDAVTPGLTLPNQLGDVVYTAENTVDVASMWADWTTGVYVSVPFVRSDGTAYGDDEGFFSMSYTGDGVVYEDEAALKRKLVELAELTAPMKAWRAADEARRSDAHVWSESDVTLVYADGDQTRNDEARMVPAGEVSFRFAPLTGDDIVDMTRDEATEIGKTVEGLTDIRYFKGGVAYYRVLVRHFDLDETPLSQTAEEASTYWDLYGAADDRTACDPDCYLGRYGVVRDTWYRIEIEGVRHLGSSVLPKFDHEPDDDTEDILLRIVILPWMMHGQELHF